VALVEVGERRWVIGTFGDVNWVRNLRAAGEATITIKRRAAPVKAVELSPTEGAIFFKEVLGPYVRRLPLGIGVWMNSCMLVIHSGVRVSIVAPRPPNIMIMYFIAVLLCASSRSFRTAPGAGARPLVGAVTRFSTSRPEFSRPGSQRAPRPGFAARGGYRTPRQPTRRDRLVVGSRWPSLPFLAPRPWK
jgi:hypothetical protein